MVSTESDVHFKSAQCKINGQQEGLATILFPESSLRFLCK